MADNASWRDTHRTANRAEVLARRRDLIVKKARVIDHRGCYDVCAARAGSCKDTLFSHKESAPLAIVGLRTQRNDDSVNNPEYLKQRICLTPASNSSVDNEIL